MSDKRDLRDALLDCKLNNIILFQKILLHWMHLVEIIWLYKELDRQSQYLRTSRFAMPTGNLKLNYKAVYMSIYVNFKEECEDLHLY